MKLRRRTGIAIVIIAIVVGLAVVLVPVVPSVYPISQVHQVCPSPSSMCYAVQLPKVYGSIAYHLFGYGGVAMPGHAYLVILTKIQPPIGFVMYNSSSASLPTSSTIVSTSSMSVVTLGPQPLAGELSGQNASCSLESGVCTFTVVNNGTASLEPRSCQTSVIVATQVVAGTGTVVKYATVNGTVGGPAAVGIPAGSEVTMTCTFPTTQLIQQPSGSQASGAVWVNLTNSWYSYPAGTQTGFSFEGVWS